MLTPGVRVQVPPRAPEASKSKDFGAFFISRFTAFAVKLPLIILALIDSVFCVEYNENMKKNAVLEGK